MSGAGLSAHFLFGAGDICCRAVALLCICNRWSIHAADLSVGAGSSDLDGRIIQSQETEAIPTSCSLLARDQRHLVLEGAWLLDLLSPGTEAHRRASQDGKHKAPLTSV